MNDTMKNLTPAAVAAVTGGEVRGKLPDGELTGVCIDSRLAAPGGLFAAIPGERADGHDYIASAGEKGAACVLCERFAEADVPQIKVPDTQAALRKLAAYYRRQFSIPVIGVTGSVGKTTAKEMIASVLAERYATLKTEKNYNNELGVPLTLFRLRRSHEAAVVEMGISGFGEMTRLAEMVRPDIAVFTLIGDAHLEFLGSREGVLRAKGEIVSGMTDDGVVIANGDDALLKKHDFGRKTVLFGKGEDCAVRAEDICPGGVSGTRCTVVCDGRRIPLHIPAVGAHMVYAALMGVAAGAELGLSDDEIRRGAAHYEPVGSRGRVTEAGGVTILDDCYNANPTSMRAAIDTLSTFAGRRVAVLGDMFELGENAPALHREIGAYAAKTGSAVIACGALAENIAAGAGEGALWYPDAASLIAALPDIIQKGDAVLVKASHSMRFESIVEALKGKDC